METYIGIYLVDEDGYEEDFEEDYEDDEFYGVPEDCVCDWEPEYDLDCGFDPYMGCYTEDC